MPTEHVASTRQVDEHIWTELRNFKKCLLQMHMAQVPTLLLYNNCSNNTNNHNKINNNINNNNDNNNKFAFQLIVS